jgi:protein translocase SecG subunit
MNIQTLKIAEIVISVLLVLLILIQTKTNGFSQSLSSRFSFHRTKRGLENFVFYLTIVLSVIFVVNTLVLILMNK